MNSRHASIPMSLYMHTRRVDRYGVATISRLLKIIGLFCKRALQKRLCSAKETWDFKEPTNRSHPILILRHGSTYKFETRIYIWIRHTHLSVWVYICTRHACMHETWMQHNGFWDMHLCVMNIRLIRNGANVLQTHIQGGQDRLDALSLQSVVVCCSVL